VAIAIPTFLAAIFYGLVASDQYAVEVKFAVRGSSNSSTSGDVLGIFSGLGGPGSTLTDSYIVIDYINSRELVDALDGKIGLRQIYSRDQADYFSRLDPAVTGEELVKYWRKMVAAHFDNSSQIVTVEVKAFTAEDAQSVAAAILDFSEKLINDLSTRARADAVKSALQDLKRVEDQLKANRTALRAFRDTKEEFDPVKQVEARYSILSKLEQDLSAARTKLASLKNFMGDNAPSVTVLKGDIAALERQVEEERAKLGNKGAESGHQSLGGLVANYEELVVDREFSEKAYVSALASLERARIEADRQQRYLAAFVRPSVPHMALYPKRLVGTLSVLAISSLLWALGVLVAYAVRDHAL
jgi:capsular polysaccharide transport system permease protein